MSGHHALEATGLAGDPASRVHRLDPRAKLCGLLGITLVAVSAPLRAWPVFVGCALALAAVAAAARVPAGTVWRRARIVLPVVLLVAAAAPFVSRGGATWALGPLQVSEAGVAVLATAGAKATLGTVSAVLLGATTTFPATLRGVEALRVPALLVLIAGFAYRYLFVIADELRRMRTALAARGHRPRHVLQAAAGGRLAIALFLRTHARGERVYLAMLARGWNGAMPHVTPLAFRRADAAFVAIVVVPLLALRVALELAS